MTITVYPLTPRGSAALLKVCVGLLVVSLYSGFRPAFAAEGPPPAPVVVAKAQERQMAPTVWVAGSVISRHDARVPGEVAGRLEFVADVGEAVAKGQPVARLDNTLAELELNELEAQVERNRARLKFLEREVKRLQRLAKQNNAAQTQLDQTESDRDTARSELTAAQARLERARVRLQRHVVRAPFSGVIAERIARAGEWLNNGDPVVRLVDPKALEIQAKAPLSVKSSLAPGREVRVLSNDGKTVRARVRTIVPVGDSRSRLFELRLDFDGPGWSHGQSVRVAGPTALPREVVAVPRDALVLRRDGASVFRVSDGVADRVKVTVGVASGPWIEVRGGVQPGDQIIIRGGERMRPGQPVRIANGASGVAP